MWSLVRAINNLVDVLAERNQTMSALDDILTEIAANLNAVSEQLAKGFGEITAKLEELSNAAEAGETVDPATLDALHAQVTALANQAQAIDDVVPDVTEEEPPA